jgi:hypothetical protein
MGRPSASTRKRPLKDREWPTGYAKILQIVCEPVDSRLPNLSQKPSDTVGEVGGRCDGRGIG